MKAKDQLGASLRVSLRLAVVLPAVTLLSMLVLGFLISDRLPDLLTYHDVVRTDVSLAVALTIFVMILVAFTGSLLVGLFISYRLRKLLNKAGSLIPLLDLSAQEIRAASEIEALGIMLDEARVSLTRFIQDSYILEYLPEAVVTVDRMLQVTALNRKAARVFHSELWNLKGSKLDRLIPKNVSNEAFYRLVRKGLAGEESSTQMMTISLGEGKDLQFWLSINPVRQEEGFSGVTITFKDHLDIVSVRNQIQKLERLAAVGQVSAHIAHEVRNPLGAIKTLTELAREDLPADDPRRGYSDVVLQQVERLNRLVEDLLSFSRDAIVCIEPVDIRDVLSRAVTVARHNFADHPPDIVERYRDDVPELVGDSERLVQAFLNIIVNACEATGQGGQVVVSAERGMGPEGGNGHISVSITDNGPGIPMEEQARIFEPFHTTKAKGTGLGLPCSQHIILAHGGHLDVSSELGRGATFSVLLPMKRPGQIN